MYHMICALRVHSYSFILAPEGYVGHSRGALQSNPETQVPVYGYLCLFYINQSRKTISLTHMLCHDLLCFAMIYRA